jgi:transcriptional regulator with XRE-family HTH domain
MNEAAGRSIQQTVKVPRETIGQRVKRLRMERGFSQRGIAGPGVSYAYVSRIEAGTRQPSLKALRTLAQRLGVTALYLELGSDTVRCPHCGRNP